MSVFWRYGEDDDPTIEIRNASTSWVMEWVVKERSYKSPILPLVRANRDKNDENDVCWDITLTFSGEL